MPTSGRTTKSAAKAPADTLYIGFCHICDEDTVFAGVSPNMFVCTNCRNEIRLESAGHPYIAEA